MISSMVKSAKRLQRSLRPVGSVDALAGARVAGWACSKGPVEVEVWLGNRRVATCLPSIARPDVAQAFPRMKGAATSGFSLDLPAGALAPDDLAEMKILARPRNGILPASTIGTFPVVGANLARKFATAGDSGIVGPFPKDVIDATAAVWPEACADLNTVEGQTRFVDRLKQVMNTASLNALPVFSRYSRYLSATMAHCRFVERHFPAVNTTSAQGAADFHCKPNSISELFSIIHQLYVLKSWGISGDFAEFGCFKGYSSAMLSYACAQLGINMHIFDSFEGLPPAPGSGYEAGQYAGSLDEVRDHVERFGHLPSVTFHKGFFADTFKTYTPPPLMCLWMDVDLEVSSQDLMVVADRLDPRASLFSHECTSGIFQAGEIRTSVSPDNPIPPMLARHEELGRPLTGRYVAGYTGAFWPKQGGIPVIDTEVLAQLTRSLP
ncbi:hypothetical protein IP81_02465 [Novosphingobium sp. AAP83]|uniref:TylF/MycF/NovP-related O-methyltransferase n=1 Tax=Novosphingobium sp. AAP83 TaxID=1523425 RepID=UPI0006B9554F|nr:TylF/MycF/NovP-related O-methyltransferase [Novosphingobium sp. AAP83]KPF93604.1 hypothetical protein IP81_02465 [Novosphingobium sp. AAP83]